MTLEEWKYYRNTTVKEIETLNKKELAKTLGIEMDLARDIQNGDYNHQIKAWEDIVREKEKNKRMLL